MTMEDYFRMLKDYMDSHAPNCSEGDSVLSLLYETYAECNKIDDGTIKADFNELYRLMNGMPLREMDMVLKRSPVITTVEITAI